VTENIYTSNKLVCKSTCSWKLPLSLFFELLRNCVEIAVRSCYSWPYGYRSMSEITRKGTPRVFQVQTKLWKNCMRKEEGRGDLLQCTRIQFNAQGTQCAEWIIPPQSQISLYRPNSAAATTTNAAATSRTRGFIPGAFISPGARSRVHVYIYAAWSVSRTNGLKKRAGIARADVITLDFLIINWA